MNQEQRIKALEDAVRGLEARQLEHEQNDDKRMTNMSRETMQEVRNLSGRIQENYNRVQELRQDTVGDCGCTDIVEYAD